MSHIRGAHGVKIPKHKAKLLKLNLPSKRIMTLYRKAVVKHLEHSNTSYIGRSKEVDMLREHFEASVYNAEARFLNAIRELEDKIAVPVSDTPKTALRSKPYRRARQ
jgi:hypothetical protein